ncbi:hypothetical protein DFJ67_6852 [Asanoa ferruginea]|uniref:PH (Pleckstrin Homology) domain-containing protein n=1 Tax=Asanoa ferruginea TaxID=53367 RepID=A0A3D9ZVY0_9ACTN|nr:hypothetical protein [Asanoa ferruginea]REG00795.1 hypothetical protein DFJ67_6852 [Asanoa ferruginea]GIF47330.1 hypothetical protein Afe04nite_18690 [Asanoa ferruginea]
MRIRRVVAVGAGVAALTAAWFEATYESDDGLWASMAVRLSPSAALVVAGIVPLLRRSSVTVAFVTAAGNQVFRTRPAAIAIWWPAVVAVALTANFAAFAPTTWEPGTDPEWQVDVMQVVLTAFLGLMAATVVVVYLRGVWLGRPAVELTRDGVRVLAQFGYRYAPWDEVQPGTPLRPVKRTDNFSLSVTGSNLARWWGIAIVPFLWLDIHPWFLTDAIRYYVAHPEHRAAIGTAEEHDRLRHLLSEAASVGGASHP